MGKPGYDRRTPALHVAACGALITFALFFSPAGVAHAQTTGAAPQEPTITTRVEAAESDGDVPTKMKFNEYEWKGFSFRWGGGWPVRRCRKGRKGRPVRLCTRPIGRRVDAHIARLSVPMPTSPIRRAAARQWAVLVAIIVVVLVVSGAYRLHGIFGVMVVSQVKISESDSGIMKSIEKRR